MLETSQSYLLLSARQYIPEYLQSGGVVLRWQLGYHPFSFCIVIVQFLPHIYWQSQDRQAWRYSLRWIISAINPVWHDVWKQEKWSSLELPRANFYKTLWTVQSVKLTWCQFSPPNKIEIFWKKISWQYLIQKGQGDKKYPLPCQIGLKCLRSGRKKSLSIAETHRNYEGWIFLFPLRDNN